jgi:hypothetical protein
LVPVENGAKVRSSTAPSRRFATRDQARVPEHWHGYDGRRSVLDYGRSPRKAATPINAMLNYCYALDIIEPTRPLVDRSILDLLGQRSFRAADFHETPAGSCRILAPLTHELAETARCWIGPIHATAEYVANSVADQSPAPIRLSTPLTGASRRSAGARQGKSQRRSRKESPQAAPTPRRCRDCGCELSDTARKLSQVCWPVSRAAQARARAAAGIVCRLRATTRFLPDKVSEGAVGGYPRQSGSVVGARGLLSPWTCATPSRAAAIQCRAPLHV